MQPRHCSMPARLTRLGRSVPSEMGKIAMRRCGPPSGHHRSTFRASGKGVTTRCEGESSLSLSQVPGPSSAPTRREALAGLLV
jgi:hypothetical protein